MRGRRSVIVAVALVLGVVAGGASYAFLHSVQQRAYNGAKLTDVYVADATIGRGVTGAAAVGGGLIKKTQIPAKFEPAGTITDLAAIQSEVATSDIPAGQIVVGGLFASPASTASTASQDIPKGDVAITVSVDPVHGVAGLIQPGDQVDILIGTPPGETYLYQNVPVLAVGTTMVNRSPATVTSAQTPAAAPAPAPSSNLITFAVPPDAAARIAYAQNNGGGSGNSTLYLALVPPGSTPSATPPVINPSNLIPASRIPG